MQLVFVKLKCVSRTLWHCTHDLHKNWTNVPQRFEKLKNTSDNFFRLLLQLSRLAHSFLKYLIPQNLIAVTFGWYWLAHVQTSHL